MTTQVFDLSVNLLQCLLWQYNDAAKLQSLVQSKQAWYDASQEGFWTAWIRDVFDLTTANDFGLSVWAIILGVPLAIVPQSQLVKPLWGYGPDDVGYTQGNFAAANIISALTTEQRRLVLRLRYFQLTTRATVPEVNAFLAQVFGPGQVYVRTAGPMQIEYHFATPPSSAVELVLSQFDILPRPAGVQATHVVG